MPGGLAKGWRRMRREKKSARCEAVRGKWARQDSPAALEWTGRQAPGLQAPVGCLLDMASPSVMVRRCHPESSPKRDEESGRWGLSSPFFPGRFMCLPGAPEGRSLRRGGACPRALQVA
jgi:hypothetical protein